MSDETENATAQPAPPVPVTSEANAANPKPKTVLRPPVDKMARPGVTRGYLTK